MHSMIYNAATNSAICSCRMILIPNCSEGEAAVEHAHHIESERLRPTDPTKLHLASVNRRSLSGFYQGGYVA